MGSKKSLSLCLLFLSLHSMTAPGESHGMSQVAIAVQNMEGRLEAFILSCYVGVWETFRCMPVCSGVYSLAGWMCLRINFFSGYYVQYCSSLNIDATSYSIHDVQTWRSQGCNDYNTGSKRTVWLLLIAWVTHMYNEYMHWLYRYYTTLTRPS